jgi:hypothetical protein
MSSILEGWLYHSFLVAGKCKERPLVSKQITRVLYVEI